MAWTFWMPDKPENLGGTLVAGGTLAASTTYYFKVFAWDVGYTYATRYNVTQSSIQVLSPYSDTFSITTDTTNLSVALTWDKCYKRDGITEVDAYEVMFSTSDNFDSADDRGVFSPVSYYTPATYTNSYTIIS